MILTAAGLAWDTARRLDRDPEDIEPADVAFLAAVLASTLEPG